MKTLERKFDKTKIKKNFKEVLWFYDFWGRLTESKAEKIVIELAEIEDRKRILEVACGTGVLFEQIVRRNPNGENVGIDLSPDMLNKARKRLSKSAGHFTLKEGDAFALEFDDETFDIVFNNYMVDLLPLEYLDQVAQEFHRVLRPQGIILVSTFSFGTKTFNKFWLWLATHFPGLLTGCRPISFKENLLKAGFSIENDREISQNTFPSRIIKAKRDN